MAEPKIGSSRGPTPFDRLYGPRRNKKFRNISLITAGVTGFTAIVLLLDTELSGQPLKEMPLFIAGLLSFLCTGLSIYFHMRYLSRD